MGHAARSTYSQRVYMIRPSLRTDGVKSISSQWAVAIGGGGPPSKKDVAHNPNARPGVFGNESYVKNVAEATRYHGLIPFQRGTETHGNCDGDCETIRSRLDDIQRPYP